MAKVAPDLTPKTAVTPQLGSTPKVAPKANLDTSKQPKAVADGGRFDKQVTWCTTKIDHEGRLSWNEPREWTEAEWENVIHPAFTEFGKMTWSYVDLFASGSEHKMHHSQALSRIANEAQSRWMELDLGEFADSLFRFRLGGKRRAWGYVLQAHFHMVWWERHHRIHKPKK